MIGNIDRMAAIGALKSLEVRYFRTMNTGSWGGLAACTAALMLCVILANSAWSTPAFSRHTTFLVGPDRPLKTPSAAARLARAGDTIEIDPAVYRDDYTVWHQDNLTIRAPRGMAHMQSTRLIPNGKGIWVISGDNVTVENIEFSGARVVDTNGAGIRGESRHLTLRNTFFHHNEFSILTDNDPLAELVIEDSRFWHQQRTDTFSHGMYIGAIRKFTLTGSHVMGTRRGHQIKTRAHENHILYNRIEDIPGGNSSRLIDFSNCGLSYVMGNDMHQTSTTHNIDAIGYGPEGCDGRNIYQRRLYVINNTFVNQAWTGFLVRNHVGAEALVANNLTFGRVRALLGKGDRVNNLNMNLNRLRPDWLPPAGSRAIDGAKALPHAADNALTPTRVFKSPTGTEERKIRGQLDIGSRERDSSLTMK